MPEVRGLACSSFTHPSPTSDPTSIHPPLSQAIQPRKYDPKQSHHLQQAAHFPQIFSKRSKLTISPPLCLEELNWFGLSLFWLASLRARVVGRCRSFLI